MTRRLLERTHVTRLNHGNPAQGDDITLQSYHRMFRTWYFEPALATACFSFFIQWYWMYERNAGKSRDASFYSLFQSCELGNLSLSFIGYWIGIIIWVNLVPPVAQTIPDGIPASLLETAYLILEVVSGVVFYDAIFYVIHLAMHKVPVLRSLHSTHHRNSEVESRDTLQHSVADASLQVLVNILVQRRVVWGSVKTRLARALHNVVVIWMLTESHAAAPQPYIWRRWFRGVRDHRLHHANEPRFQQFFGYLDDWRLRHTT